LADKFYVHSEEFWGYPSRRWAVFERTEAWSGRWKRVSKFFLTSRPVEKLRDRMLADWTRYERAMMTRDDDTLTVRYVDIETV
jgi:hypothetical protein